MPDEVTRCQGWHDHEWSSRAFVESGRHPTMGRFNRFVMRCAKCQRTTTQTEWIEAATVNRLTEGDI